MRTLSLLAALLAAGLGAACGLSTAGEAQDDGGETLEDVDGAVPDARDDAGDRPDTDADTPRDDGETTDDDVAPDAADDGLTDGPSCGNGIAEWVEECDGDDLRGLDCADLGRAPGTLACTPTCTFDLATCPPLDVCGNGLAEEAEACDGDDLRGIGCADRGYAGGTLACAPDCSLDESACTPHCLDACGPEGTLRCAGTLVQVCGRGALGCLEWLVERDCAAEAAVCDTLSPGVVRCLGGAGDACDTPRAVGALPLTVSGGDITATFHDYHDFTGARCDTASGVEAIFVRWMTAGESIRIRETGSADVVIRVLAECSSSAACLASRNDPDDPGLTFTAPADGNYYVVVEALHAVPASRGYGITIEASPHGETCSDPLVADPLPATRSGGDIRHDFTDDIRFAGPGCTPADGVEAILSRTMAAGETVRLRETGSLDAVLRVLASCDPAAPCLVSRDDPETPGITFTAPAAGAYFFVVESKYAFPASVGYAFFLEDAPDGNLCTDPVRADALPTSISGGDVRTAFTNDRSFTGSGCPPADGIEVWLARTMAAGETVRLRETGSLDVVLRVLGSCDPAAPCLASRDEPENPGLSFTAPAAGTYYFVAEAKYAAPASVAYAITLDDPPPGNLCSDPVVVTALPFTLSGGDIAATFTNDLDFLGLGCTAADGVEVVLAVDAALAPTLLISERGSLDAVIRVLESCEPTASCLVSQDAPEDPGPTHFPRFAGTYYVIVESRWAFPASRGYDIRLTAP